MTITEANLEDKFIVRSMNKDDLKNALSWAVAEGWNPGIDDADSFYISDPEGFFIGELNGQPISCISVVRYHENFNFIGLYIARSEQRHKGFGLQTWQEAFKLIPDQPAALDAVLVQVANYQKFGFKSAHSHIRHQGIIKGKIAEDITDIKTIDFQQLCNYDQKYFPGDRSKFLSQWINQPHGQGYAMINDGNLIGYGVIRKAHQGFRIGPLFAENQDIAEKIFLALATYAEESPIYMDVPDINQSAITLFQKYEMKPMFECVRMYRGDKPNIDWSNVFAITTLELG